MGVNLLESTGIEDLDKILGGGLPRPSTIGLLGPLGSGKSILSREIAANMLKAGNAVNVYAIDQSADEIRYSLRAMDVDVEKYEKEGTLFFMDIFSRGVEKMKESYTKFEPGSSVLQSGLQFSDLIEMGREFTLKNLKKKQLGLMDSITPLFLMSDVREVFHYCQTLKYATRFANAIGIAVHHTGVLEQKLENALFGFADGIIELEKSSDISGGQIYGNLNVIRMLTQKFLRGKFYYEVKNDRFSVSAVAGIV